MKKRYILILSLMLVALSMSCVSAGLFDGLFGENDKDISLIKESVEATRKIYDDGEIYTAYTIKGIFKDLPDNVDGYNLKIKVFDEKGKLIKETDGFPMDPIAKKSKKSEIALLGAVYDSSHEMKNGTKFELIILNKDGKIEFDQNVSFNIENMNIAYEKKSINNDSNDNDDYGGEYHSHDYESDLYTRTMREQQAKGTYFNPNR